jgi:integrase
VLGEQVVAARAVDELPKKLDSGVVYLVRGAVEHGFELPEIRELIDTAMLQRAIDRAVREATANVAGRVLTVIRTAVREGFQDGWFVQHPDALVGRLTAPIQPARRRQGLTAEFVAAELIPREHNIADVAAAMASDNRPWWYELMVQMAATGGFRLGELLALSAESYLGEVEWVVDRQVLELRGQKSCTLPKWNKIRRTVTVRTGPGGYDVQAAITQRLEEVEQEPEFRCCAAHAPVHLLFPAPRGGWWNQSNLRNRAWTPARDGCGWERVPTAQRAPAARRGGGAADAGRDPFIWSWHSLRHYAATDWFNRGALITDVSCALGHQNTTTTTNMYIDTTTAGLTALKAL